MSPDSAPAVDHDAIRGCTAFRLRRAARLVSRRYDAAIGEADGLKTTQYSLLRHLERLGPVRPGTLARHMGLEPSSLTRNLAPLLASGWVVQGPGADGRSRQLAITPAGAACWRRAREGWGRAQQALHAALGSARVAQLHALLDDCLQLLDAAGDDAGQEDAHA